MQHQLGTIYLQKSKYKDALAEFHKDRIGRVIGGASTWPEPKAIERYEKFLTL